MNIVSVNDVAACVRQARKNRGWTQAKLAEQSGVSRDWVVGLEKAKPTQEIALVLRTMKSLGIALSLENQDQPAHSHDVVNLDDFLNACTSGDTKPFPSHTP